VLEPAITAARVVTQFTFHISNHNYVLLIYVLHANGRIHTQYKKNPHTRIFVTSARDVAGKWRFVICSQFRQVWLKGNEIKKDAVVGHVTVICEMGNAYKILVEITEESTLLE
jgi:hypothetical protein